MTITADDFDYQALQTLDGLQRLDHQFLSLVAERDPGLYDQLCGYRNPDTSLSALEISRLLLAVAPMLEEFLARRFGIEASLREVCDNIDRQNLVAQLKKEFVQKRARRLHGNDTDSFSSLSRWLDNQIEHYPEARTDKELAVAKFANYLLDDPEPNASSLARLTEWCAHARQHKNDESAVKDWISFRLPRPVDPARLVPLSKNTNGPVERLEARAETLRRRDGFSLTDSRMSMREVMDQVNYCVYCHNQDGDFCSKGFPKKKKQPELGLKVDALGVTLTGCPLEEKISEMQLLKRDGNNLAALAVAMVDNPMIPATGHRICNDCMKACIYQKQDPVDVPQIETRVLTDVLNLPWGVEIYDLLVRWNPLRRRQFLPRPDNGRKVLIVGMGPAGFTMAHHLTMEGCTVIGIDGLKIEPLPQHLIDEPVHSYAELCESLEERIMAGFGGVAEYGITVRWDKNFLKLIYLTLARRPSFRVVGGVRLGGTITLDDAWLLGFDHVCIATGAGLPRVIGMGNSLARGMRQANDFLMALQLTGAAKADSLANLQVRLPAVVIGGGLTAIDTATEVQAYYVKQVEKTLDRFEQLTASSGEQSLIDKLDEEGQLVLKEFLQHGRAVRAERERAAIAGEHPNFNRLVREWGGVTIVYRRSINESPAYLRNHEEIIKALEEGVYYVEGLEPLRADLDRFGHVEMLVCRQRVKREGRWISLGKEVNVPARAIMVAAGTFPNIIYEREHPGTLRVEDNHFLTHVAHKHGVQPVGVAEHCKAPEFGPFTSYDRDHRRVSFIGDAHPVFNGSVVKAIASANRSYPEIVADLMAIPEHRPRHSDSSLFVRSVADQLTTRIADIDLKHPVVIELWVRAPMAAKNFQPGQFFRLQTYETLSPKRNGTRLQIPLLTVSGAGVRGDCVRLLLLRFGANAQLAAQLKPGDRIVLMGPTGAPTAIENDKTFMVIAGSWGAAVMLGLGPALRAKGNRVLYFSAYDTAEQVYYQDELEQCADQIVWATAKGTPITANRPRDISVQSGNVIDLLRQYHRGEFSEPGQGILLTDVNEVLVIGSTGLLRGLQSAMQSDLRDVFREDVNILGTVGSPMQCMLKGVCAQCLQWQIDPDSGERTRAVFSCAMQDQPLMWIDIDNLAARQAQNRLQEQLGALWVEYVLGKSA